MTAKKPSSVFFVLALACSIEVCETVLADYDGRLPVEAARRVDPNNPETPEALRDFFETYRGKPNADGKRPRPAVYWDVSLNTPRYVSPREVVIPILPDPGHYLELGSTSFQDILALAVLEFVDAHADFFGVTSSQLSTPVVRSVGNDWLVNARQLVRGVSTSDNVFIRGANVRFLVRADGSLGALKTFLLRDAPRDNPPFCSLDSLRNHIASEMHGYHTIHEERQYLFRPEEGGTALWPIWRVQFTGPEHSGEFLVSSETCELNEERRYFFELGIGGVEGEFTNVLANIPTTNPDDGHFYFTTPQDDHSDNLKPIPGARVHFKVEKGDVSESVFEFTDSQGRAVVPRGKDITNVMVRRVTLDPLIDGIGKDDCENIGPATLRIIDPWCFGENCRIFRPADRCWRDVCPEGSWWLFTNSDPRFTPPTESPRRRAAYQSYFHLHRFFRNYIDNLSALEIETEGAFPLEVSIRGTPDEARYFPNLNNTPSRICLSPLDWNDQPLTPTFVYHEAAHHAIFDVTGSLVSRSFDCVKAPCLPEDLLPRDPLTEREIQLIEGATDALAAYFTGLPQFGFTKSGPDATAMPGPNSYDISLDPTTNTVLDSTRAIYARLLWDVREALMALSRIPEFPRNADEINQDAERILYRWLARHVTVENSDRTFVFSPVLLEELHDVVDDLEFDFDPTIRQKYLGAVGSAFDGIKILQAQFVRGDGDHSGRVDMTDALRILLWLFVDGSLEEHCLAPLDADDSGEIDLEDPLAILRHQFLGHPHTPPPPPYPGCGFEPLDDEAHFGCFRYGACGTD